jgi:hypothetical protein
VSSTIENLTDTLIAAIIYRFRRGEGLTAQVCEPSSSRSRYTGAIDTRQILRCRVQRSLIAQTVVNISVETFWPGLCARPCTIAIVMAHHHDQPDPRSRRCPERVS